jgi:hypothetical protein
MEEQIIKTKRGLYGRVNITLPITFKNYILDLQKKTGMKKAEFLRIALITGAAKLSEKVIPKDQNGLGEELSAHRT